MTKEEFMAVMKNEIRSAFKVNVVPSKLFDRCNTCKSCNNKPEYNVFNGDGEPKSSRLMFMTCRKHLPLAIKKAWGDNHAQSDKIRNS